MSPTMLEFLPISGVFFFGWRAWVHTVADRGKAAMKLIGDEAMSSLAPRRG
jgi:hypothetical protein